PPSGGSAPLAHLSNSSGLETRCSLRGEALDVGPRLCDGTEPLTVYGQELLAHRDRDLPAAHVRDGVEDAADLDAFVHQHSVERSLDPAVIPLSEVQVSPIPVVISLDDE